MSSPDGSDGDKSPEFVEIKDDDSMDFSELDMSLGSFPAFVGQRAPSGYVPPASRAPRLNTTNE